MSSNKLEINLLESVETISEIKKITDLNADCLEVIFAHLELNELINVADSSKVFYTAVCHVYKRKFGNIIPTFSPDYWWTSFPDHEKFALDASDKNPQILIHNPKILLKLLRNFGHLIKALHISYWKPNPKVYVDIETYLSEYCSNSLQWLSVQCSLSENPFENLQNPLKGVISFRISTTAVKSINQIRFINENSLPNVQCIYLYNQNINLQVTDSIYFKLLCKIEYFTLRTMRINAYPFPCENLKYLTTFGSVDINDTFCEFISKIKHLKKLKFYPTLPYYRIESFNKLLELQNVISNVEELEFELGKHALSICELVLRFVKQSKRLQKLSIHFYIPSNYTKDSHNGRDHTLLMRTISTNMNGEEWKFSVKYPYHRPLEPGKFFGSTYKCFIIEKISNG